MLRGYAAVPQGDLDDLGPDDFAQLSMVVVK
jgi:hypothetical protein